MSLSHVLTYDGHTSASVCSSLPLVGTIIPFANLLQVLFAHVNGKGSVPSSEPKALNWSIVCTVTYEYELWYHMHVHKYSVLCTCSVSEADSVRCGSHGQSLCGMLEGYIFCCSYLVYHYITESNGQVMNLHGLTHMGWFDMYSKSKLFVDHQLTHALINWIIHWIHTTVHM